MTLSLAPQDLMERDSNGDMPNLSFYRNEIRFQPNGADLGLHSLLLGRPPPLSLTGLLGPGLRGPGLGLQYIGPVAFRWPHSTPWRLLRGLQGSNLQLGPCWQTCCDGPGSKYSGFSGPRVSVTTTRLLP